MDDLVAFLTARLDEDELAAKVAAVDDAWDQLRRTIPQEPGTLNRCHRLMNAFDPARVLREVAAKRALIGDENDGLALYAVHERGVWPDELTRHADEALRHLAAVYSDHPDYRAEWKP